MPQSENRRLSIIQAREVRQAVDELLSSPVPARTIGRAIGRRNDPSATPFERYVGMVLRDAGGEQIVSLPPSQPVRLVPPSEGHLVRLTCPVALPACQAEALVDVENALNRLLCIADAIEDAPMGNANDEQGIVISFLGVGLLRNRAGYRSAQVTLPPIGPTEQAPIGYFNEVDWRMLDHVASAGRAVFQNSMLPNMNQSILGTYAADGSDWDVRTRLASIIGRLELPFRCDCRFDCNAEQKAVSVRFTAPVAHALPRYKADPSLKNLEDTGTDVDNARMAYVLRVACLMGAACFGSGKHIERAFIVAEETSDKAPVLSCVFSRDEYVRTALMAIDSGRLADASLRFDPDAIAALIRPEHLSYSLMGIPTASIPDDGMEAQRVDPHDDCRPLGKDARRVFHSKRVCDIDTTSYHGTHGSDIDEALSDARDSMIAAIARLEGIVDELERTCVPPDDDARSRPLYCDQPLSRAMVSLLDDQVSVGEQAEAFLRDMRGHTPREPQAPRYFRAPSALFHAHMGLSDLYERLGDFAGAEAEANRCIALAPSTARSHFRKADILAQQGRYAEAANIILFALRFMASERDCSLLYYHLALILWNLERKREAAAIYVYTTFLKGDYAEKALRVVTALRKREDHPVILSASPLAAAREMSRLGIPVAPSDSARMLVAKAAVSLCNSHAPRAAAPYACALAHYLRDDEIIRATCQSIQFGTNSTNEVA